MAQSGLDAGDGLWAKTNEMGKGKIVRPLPGTSLFECVAAKGEESFELGQESCGFFFSGAEGGRIRFRTRNWRS